MIASLVALSAASMRVRRSFWASVRALSSARSKFSEREGHIIGQSLQQFRKFWREGVLVEGHVDHDADRLAANQQRKGGA